MNIYSYNILYSISNEPSWVQSSPQCLFQPPDADGDEHQHEDQQGRVINPQIMEAVRLQQQAADDFNEIGKGQDIGHRPDVDGHGLQRKDKPGQQDGRDQEKDGQEDRLLLGLAHRGDGDPEGDQPGYIQEHQQQQQPL